MVSSMIISVICIAVTVAVIAVWSGFLILTVLCICSSRLCSEMVWSQPEQSSHEVDTAAGPAGWRLNAPGHTPPTHKHTHIISLLQRVICNLQ